MSYLDEINAFWDLQEINRLSTGQVALWFGLMDINNKCAWIEWFTVAISTLEAKTALSRSGVYKARSVLRKKGYVDFKENGNGKPASYKLLTLSYSAQDKTHLRTQIGTQDRTPLNRVDKTRLDNNKKEKDKKEKMSIPPSLEEVQAYCLERNNAIDAQSFIDFYASKGWLIGKSKMVDWQAAIRTWEKNTPQVEGKVWKIFDD